MLTETDAWMDSTELFYYLRKGLGKYRIFSHVLVAIDVENSHNEG